MKKYITNIPFLLPIIAFIGERQTCTIHYISLTVALCITLYFYFLLFRQRRKAKIIIPYQKLFNIYLLWVCVTFIRSIFYIEYWDDARAMVNGAMLMFLPIIIWHFTVPSNLNKLLAIWCQKWILLSITLLLFFFVKEGYAHLLAPAFFLIFFYEKIPSKYKKYTWLILVIVLYGGFSARSNILRFAMIIVFTWAFISHGYFNNWIKIGWTFLIFLPIILVSIGIAGIYNPFEALEKDDSFKIELKEAQSVSGDATQMANADTRTFLYTEVIKSSIKNDYWLLGHSFARGYECNSLMGVTAYLEQHARTGRMERVSCEVGMLNPFTWMGIIGFLLYATLIIWASWIGVFRGKNKYVRGIGMFIAFRFLFSFIEEMQTFSWNSITLWLMIAICISSSFLNMTNNVFEIWIKNIFHPLKKYNSST